MPLDAESTRSLAWSPDGCWVGQGSADGTVRVFDVSRFNFPSGVVAKNATTHTLTLRKSSIRALAFTSDRIGALDLQGHFSWWDLSTGRVLGSWAAHPARGNSLQVASDNQWVITGGLDGIALWDTRGMCVRRWGAGRQGVSCLHLEAKEATVAAAFLDGTIAVFALPTGRQIWSQQGHRGVTAAVALHPSEPLLASLGWEGTVKLWDAETGKFALGAGVKGGCLAWTRDGERLVVGGNQVVILDRKLTRPMVKEGDGGYETPHPAYHLNFEWDEECT